MTTGVADNERERRWLDRLTTVEGNQSFPDVDPRDAATLILIDWAEYEAKVLLGKRHNDHKFMPGKFVFPGGQLEPLDEKMSALGELHPDVEKKLNTHIAAPIQNYARALALAAVRETAEETGLLIGAKRNWPPETPGIGWREFVKACVHPDLSQMHFVARAITPPRRPKRFDTRFFTADASAIAHRINGVVGINSELVELTWVPIDRATKLDLPTITSVILEELESRLKAGMSHDLPVPFYYVVDQKFRRELL